MVSSVSQMFVEENLVYFELNKLLTANSTTKGFLRIYSNFKDEGSQRA